MKKQENFPYQLSLYVGSGDLSNITESVKFADILKVKIDDEKNEVTLKLKNGKTIFVVIDSKVSINFMLSILRNESSLRRIIIALNKNIILFFLK